MVLADRRQKQSRGIVKQEGEQEQELEQNKKRKYNFRRKVQLDYSALNEGEDKVAKFKHPHIEIFNREFEKYYGKEDYKSIVSYDEYVEQFESINVPLKIRDPENSGIIVKVKGANKGIATVEEVLKCIGEDHPVNVMDVQSQENETWTMSQWNDYFGKPHESRDRIRNVISLEVSDCDILEFNRPNIVNTKDMVDITWNISDTHKDDVPRPKITKYCLMSVKDAFTDYHLDFAGTCVYYNLVFGKKRFILYPPTPHNLAKYVEWSTSTYQNSIFLGTELEDGIAMELNSGDLFMIPAGYIHVVYTPEDSLIFGGNYLTFRDISKHLKIVEVEKDTGVPKKYTFPNFDEVMGRTCEWLIKQALNDQKYDLNFEDIEGIANYVKQGKTKYKPVDYNDKRSMLRKLTSIYSS